MDQFLEHNAGWMITLVSIGLGFFASWVRTTDKVKELNCKLDEQRKEHNERMDKQDRVLEEIKTTGSPSSRTAIMVLNSRVEDQSIRLTGQANRIVELEKIAAIVAGMAKDIEWIKLEITKQHSK